MKTPIFHSYGKWYLSGVNTWTVNLIRAMKGSEFDSKVLFTGIPRSPHLELDQLGVRYDFLDVPSPRKRKDEWQALKQFLEAHTPCIYITNFDFHRSCAVGTLNPAVRVLTVIHSDEDCYYDELRRIGTNCDAIVCVSSYLTEKVKQRFPKLADRVHFIPYGIPIPDEPPPARPTTGPLRLCYCNRLQQYQKRVFDLPLIAAELEKLGVDYELDIAGDGPDTEELRKRFDAANLKSPIRFHGRIPNAAVMDLCRRSHLFLLTSDFEGLPISLLEAMSVGCVPIVYEIESGVPDAVSSEAVGFRIPHGDVALCASKLNSAAGERAILAELARNTTDHVAKSYADEVMADRYSRLCLDVIQQDNRTGPTRTPSVILPFDLTLKHRILRRLMRLVSAQNRRSI